MCKIFLILKDVLLPFQTKQVTFPRKKKADKYTMKAKYQVI